MSSEVIAIFPYDDTTLFLEDVYSYIKEHLGSTNFRVGLSKEEHQECLSYIKNSPANTNIVFLGHGTSNSLLGSFSDTFAREVLFSSRNFHTLYGKRVFALACRSRELLGTNRISGIGFGNIPTHMMEIFEARNGNANRYYGIDEEDIKEFRFILSSVTKKAYVEYITENLSIYELYLRLKLRFNKEINRLILTEQRVSIESLVNLICETKKEMKYFE